jgi:tetratricopeptide (TPR) repeat protein
LYDELGLLEQSLLFARRSVALAAQLQGVDSPQHLRQLVELARLLNHADGLVERQQVLAQGLAIAQRLPQRASPARAMLYAELAQLHQSGDQALAESYAQRAVTDARAVGDDGGLWQALSVAGTVAKGRSDPALALARFSEALRVGERVATAPGYDLQRVRVMLAESQSSLMQPRAAEATLRAALVESLRTLGPDHLDTHQTRLRLGRVLAVQERPTVALAEQTINLESLEAAPQPDLFTLPMVLVEMSRELLVLGRLPQAEATARRAISLRDQARAGTLMSAELREDLANALIAQQRLREAGAVLQEAATIRRANKSLPGQASWDRNAHTALALAWASSDQQDQMNRQGRQEDPAAVVAIFAGLLAGSEADPPTSIRWLQGTLLRTDWDIRKGDLAAAQNRLVRVSRLLREKELVGRLPLTEVQQVMLCARLADARGAVAVASGLWQDAFTRMPAALGPEAPLRTQLTRWYAKRPKVTATGGSDAAASPC